MNKRWIFLFLTAALNVHARNPVVAVIDTGIDANNSKLRAALWTNPGESGVDSSGSKKQSNQIDDDRNGYVDDVHGWNFAGNNQNINDEHGHGTHISGIIHRLAPEAQLLPLKYYDPSKKQSLAPNGLGNISATVQALKYAIQMHVDIINYSGGGGGKDPEEERAIKEAEKAGILVIAAAGNEGHSSDKTGFYPASYHYRNIISVASIDDKNEILASSNYGVSTVDLAAPGKNIISDIPGDLQGSMTGTSQATAFVTGTAALILSVDKLPYDLLKHQILSSIDDQKNLQGKTREGGRLNSERALKMKSQRQTALGEIISETQGSYSMERISELMTESANETILP